MKQSKFKFAIFVFLCLLFFGIYAPFAEAVQVKKVYRGIINFGVGETLRSADIGGIINPAQSIVLISSSAANATGNAHGERNFFFTAQLSGIASLQVERGAGSTNASVAWQVIEFLEGVRVQSGLASIDPGMLTKTVTLPPLSTSLDSTRSIPIITFRTTTGGDANTSYGRTNEFFLEPVLSQSGIDTLLSFRRLKAGKTSRDKPVIVAWQVVEFQTDAAVYAGTVSMPVSSVSGTQSVTNNGNDPDGMGPLLKNSGPFNPPLSNNGSNALLFFYPKYGTRFAGEDAPLFIRGIIADDKTVTFTRGYTTTASNSTAEIRFYIVDFTEGVGPYGGLGKGLKGSFNSTDESPLRAISKALNQLPILNTTTLSHAFTVDDFVNVGGVNNITSANGNWLVHAVPFPSTFSTKTIGGVRVDGTLGFANGTAGKTAKARMTDLGPVYGTIDPTRFVTLASASSTNSAATATTHWADDLLFLNYVYQKGLTWYLVTARDSSGRQIAAVQDYFTYEFPSLTLKNPNGGVTWAIDSGQTIAWVSAESVAEHDWRFEISLDGGAKYVPMTGAGYGRCGTAYNKDCTRSATGVGLSAGKIPWRVSDSVGTNVKLRLVDLTDASTDPDCRRHCDASNMPFTIQGSISNVLLRDSDQSASVLYVGDTDSSVTWKQIGDLGTVTIDMDTDGDGLFGADDDPDDAILKTGQATGPSGDYRWTWTPSVGNYAGETLKVRVFSESDPGVKSVSPSFAIRPTIQILTPSLSSRLFIGQSYTISYCTSGSVGNVRLSLSSDGGTVYNRRLDSGVLSGVSPTRNVGPTSDCRHNEAQWNWIIDPATPVGDTMKIKIEKADQVEVFTKGPGKGPADTFEIIKPSITLLHPSANSVLQGGAENLISWTVNGKGGIGSLSIKYTTSWSTCQNASGEDPCWVALPDALNLEADSSPFSWKIENLAGTDIGIRIQDTKNVDLIYDNVGPLAIQEAVLAGEAQVPSVSGGTENGDLTGKVGSTATLPNVSHVSLFSFVTSGFQNAKTAIAALTAPKTSSSSGAVNSASAAKKAKVLVSKESKKKTLDEKKEVKEEEKKSETKELSTKTASGTVRAVTAGGAIVSTGKGDIYVPFGNGAEMLGYRTASDVRRGDIVTVTYQEMSGRNERVLVSLLLNQKAS